MTGEEAATGHLRGSQSGSDRLTPCGWAFAYPARIDHRRAAQRGPERGRVRRVRPRLSEALRSPNGGRCVDTRPNAETGNTGPLRGPQMHSDRGAPPRRRADRCQRPQGGPDCPDRSGEDRATEATETGRRRPSQTAAEWPAAARPERPRATVGKLSEVVRRCPR